MGKVETLFTLSSVTFRTFDGDTGRERGASRERLIYSTQTDSYTHGWTLNSRQNSVSGTSFATLYSSILECVHAYYISLHLSELRTSRLMA